MKQNRYLSKLEIAKKCVPLFAVLIADLVCLGVGSSAAALGITLIMGPFGIAQMGVAMQMGKNLRLLQNWGLYEEMISEIPEELSEKKFAVTEHFVFGWKRRAAIPLRQIVQAEPRLVRYLNNSFRDKAWLTVVTNDGETYAIIRYDGFLTDRKASLVKRCMLEIMQKNPHMRSNCIS